MSFFTKFKPYWDRFVWDVKHLFDRKAINPYVAAGEGDLKPKNRTAVEDIGHAVKNLKVEAERIIKDEDHAG